MSAAAARPSGEAKARSTAAQSGQVTSTTWWYAYPRTTRGARFTV